MIETGTNNPILRQKAKPIEKINKETSKLVNLMIQEIQNNNGVGLAAPQIGKSVRVIVIQDPNTHKTYSFINPSIKRYSTKTALCEEACLSLPGISGMVERPQEIIIEARNLNNKKVKMKLKDMLSRIFQHEYDHLEGILFIDKAIVINKQTK